MALEGVSDESNVSSASTGSEIQEAAEIAAGAVEVAKVGSSNTPDTEEPLGSLASAEAPKGDSETGEGAATKESDGK